MCEMCQIDHVEVSRPSFHPVLREKELIITNFRSLQCVQGRDNFYNVLKVSNLQGFSVWKNH